MRELFTISAGIDKAVAKPVKSINSDLKDENLEGKDFLSVMFEQIKNSIEKDSENPKLDLKFEDKEIIKIENPNGEKKSLDDHLLEDILKIVNILKNPEDKFASFPTLSKKIEKIINNEKIFNEIRDIKSLKDLFEVSKKYDLGLEKIDFKKLNLDELKKEFPLLEKKAFFEVPKESQKEKNSVLLKEQQKPTDLTLRTIDTSKKELKKEPTILERFMHKNEIKKGENNLKNEKLHVKSGEVLKEVGVKEAPKNVGLKIKDENKSEKLSVKSSEVLKDVIDKEAPKNVGLKIKDENKSEKLSVKSGEVLKDTKEVGVKTTRVDEPKIASNQQKQSMVENLMQQKSDQVNNKKTEPTMQKISNENEIKVENSNQKENTEIKSDASKVDFKQTLKNESLNQKAPLPPLKQTFGSFADDLREKIEQYKPPIMKVQLALNPKGLGEVDVTIVNRGNNLHVNISSNTNTMALFTQNQAEFKNALVNMGFTNLEMNFSDQREPKEQHQKGSSKNLSETLEEEILEDEPTSLELVMPRYI